MTVMQIHFDFNGWTREMTIRMLTVNTTFEITTMLILETNARYEGLGQQTTDQVVDLYDIAHSFLE